MAPKLSPSCRLVFCLLISAAVLRPGKRWPLRSLHCLGCRGPGAVPWGGLGVLRPGDWWGKYGSHKGALGHRPVPGNSHLCHML